MKTQPLKTSMPLNRKQVNLIADALNGCGLMLESCPEYRNLLINGSPCGLEIEIHDAMKYDNLDRVWGVDKNELLQAIRNMTPHQRELLVLQIAYAWSVCNDESAWEQTLNSLAGNQA